MPTEQGNQDVANNEGPAKQIEGIECAACSFLMLSFYFACLVATLVFPVATQREVGATLTILPATCGLASFACIEFLTLRLSGRKALGKPQAAAVPVAAVALPCPLYAMMATSAFGIQAPLQAQAIAWTAWGIGQGLLFPLIGRIQLHLGAPEGSSRLNPAVTGGALVGASVFCALSLFAPDPLRSFLPFTYFLASCALAAIASRSSRTNVESSSTDEIGKGKRVSPKMLAPLVIDGTFGILLCYGISHYEMSATLAITTIGALIGGGLFLATVATIRRSVTNSLIERLCFPITAVCFFLIAALPEGARLVPTCIVSAMFFLYSAFHWSLLQNLAHHRLENVTAYGHFGIGLFAPSVGFLAGWAIAAGYALVGGDLSHPSLLMFGWTVVYIVVLSIAPYAADTMFEIDLLADGSEAIARNPADRSGNSWEQACEQIVVQRRLSPREKEVFMMLAHGRNVEYISNTLVISSNTAKTHKYRIYRKLGVGAHQELLDLVEKTERDILGAR